MLRCSGAATGLFYITYLFKRTLRPGMKSWLENAQKLLYIIKKASNSITIT